MKSYARKSYHKIQKRIRRIGLLHTDFSIISKNCAGGYIYQYFGIEYKSPTAGLFFTDDDYLRLISNPRHYFTHTLRFINPQESSMFRLFNKTYEFPIGVIDDIEVYFMHYKSENEALSKWRRRVERVNYDKLYFLLTENEFLNTQQLKTFCEIVHNNYNRGICLTRKKYNDKYTLFVAEMEHHDIWFDHNVINAANWKSIINSL